MELFRYFDEEKWADQFCMGNVRLGTLEGYRRDEHPERGDSREATHSYNTGNATGDYRDPQFMTIAARAGVRLDSRITNLTLDNVTFETQIQDAFVLCFSMQRSERLAREFGPYCVRISDADRFFAVMTRLLQGILERAAHHHVFYNEVDYRELEEDPGPLGFVKRPRFDWQQEYRMVWVPTHLRDLEERDWLVPGVPRLCERVA